MTLHAQPHGEDSLTTTAPLRSCVVCREARETSLLLRLRERSGVVSVAGPAGGGGRGAWVCIAHPCLESLDARALSRAFRKPVVVGEPAALRAALGGIARQKILELLGLARRQGLLIVGQDQIDKQPVDCLIVAQDASDRVNRAFATSARIFATSDELSRATGLNGVFVLGIAEGSLAKQAAYWLTVWYEGQTRDGALRIDE